MMGMGLGAVAMAALGAPFQHPAEAFLLQHHRRQLVLYQIVMPVEVFDLEAFFMARPPTCAERCGAGCDPQDRCDDSHGLGEKEAVIEQYLSHRLPPGKV
jgi:hypothetical protein